MTKDDFPASATTEDDPPQSCGPLPIFEQEGGRIAITKFFSFGHFSVAEAVGAFPTEHKAAVAYDALTADERKECVRNTIIEQGSEVEVLANQSRGIGDDDMFVRFLFEDDQDEGGSFVDATSIRIGQCVAALLIAAEESDPRSDLPRQIGERAAERLADACA